MENSCNFSSDVSCDYLAQLLATGYNLDQVNVSGQIGERKIDVQMQYATAETAGVVTVLDRASQTVISEHATERTDQILEFHYSDELSFSSDGSSEDSSDDEEWYEDPLWWWPW